MTQRIREWAAGLKGRDDGITAIEYGLVSMLIALVAAVGIGLLGTVVGNMYMDVANAFN